MKLPEDITLAGFTPLMLNPQDPCYVEKTEDMVGHITLYKIGAFIVGNKFKIDYYYFLLGEICKKKCFAIKKVSKFGIDF